LTALGDPTRRAIFEMLTAHPRTVSELAGELPVSRPAVSQHLRVLKDARLVRDRREGTRRIYELNPEGLALLRDYFTQLWGQVLAAYPQAAEEMYKKEQPYDPTTSTNGSRRATLLVEVPIECAFRTQADKREPGTCA
jgi:DNA-binding transcriptional ArsR family regulator